MVCSLWSRLWIWTGRSIVVWDRAVPDFIDCMTTLFAHLFHAGSIVDCLPLDCVTKIGRAVSAEVLFWFFFSLFGLGVFVWKRPTMANPVLAILIWPILVSPIDANPFLAILVFDQNQFWPIHFGPIHFWLIQLCPNHFWIWCVSADADFGQTDFGHLYLTDFGQNWCFSLLFMCCPPRKTGGWGGWRILAQEQISVIFDFWIKSNEGPIGQSRIGLSRARPPGGVGDGSRGPCAEEDLELPLPRGAAVRDADPCRIFEQRAPVMKGVPKFLRGPFRNALKFALEEATAQDVVRQTRGWKLSVMLPRMLLHRSPGGGHITKSKLEARFTLFNQGWQELIRPSVFCDDEAVVEETDFGQSRFGHPDVANFGQSN